MATGTVKWFNPTKGFGFIVPDEGGADAFVHISAVELAGLSTLNEGQRVNYDLEDGRNGKKSAANISIADGFEMLLRGWICNRSSHIAAAKIYRRPQNLANEPGRAPESIRVRIAATARSDPAPSPGFPGR